MEEQKKFNAQLSQIIHTVENSLNQKVYGLQSEIGQNFDNLQCNTPKYTLVVFNMLGYFVGIN